MRSVLLLALLAVGASAQTKVDFRRDVAPILEKHCLECHYPGTPSNGLELRSRDELLSSGNVISGNPKGSYFYVSMVEGEMPPAKKLDDHDLAIIRDWIAQGVSWPAGVTLERPKKLAQNIQPSVELDNVRRIRERILAHQTSGSGMKTIKVTIPNTVVSFEMAPIRDGDFLMGSANGKPDEKPPHKVHVEPFWMQTREVTWDEFHLFMFANQAGDQTVDAVSKPTKPYVEMSFGMGISGFPAINMTQHAANKYAEWLSAKTGDFYRLPTEAEWEYACRAGDAPSPPLTETAWFSTNSDGKYQKVGTKKPNAWGLYDMLGNVAEWTLDQYTPYPATLPWVRPTKPYPLVARGGSWYDGPELVTCTARVASDPSWKQQDPQLPKSIWYETDAPWLGFRLVRPLKVPGVEEMFRYWNNGVEHDEQ